MAALRCPLGHAVPAPLAQRNGLAHAKQALTYLAWWHCRSPAPSLACRPVVSHCNLPAAPLGPVPFWNRGQGLCLIPLLEKMFQDHGNLALQLLVPSFHLSPQACTLDRASIHGYGLPRPPGLTLARKGRARGEAATCVWLQPRPAAWPWCPSLALLPPPRPPTPQAN